MEKYSFHDFFLNLSPLPAELRDGMIRNEYLQKLDEIIYKREFKRDGILQSAGNVPDRIWFLESGWARGIYFDEASGKDSIEYLWGKGSLIVDVEPLISQKRTELEIGVLAGSVLYYLSYADLKELFKRYPFMIDTYESFRMEQHRYSSRSFFNYQNHGLEDRLKDLFSRYPTVASGFKWKEIAAYMKVTPEHLSKIISTKKNVMSGKSA